MDNNNYGTKAWICLVITVIPLLILPSLLSVVIFIFGCIMAIYYIKQEQKISIDQMNKKYDMTMAKAVSQNSDKKIIESKNSSIFSGKERENEYIIINSIKKNNPSFSKSEYKQNAISILQELIHAYNSKNLNTLKEIETLELYNIHQANITNNNENIFKEITHFSVEESLITNYKKNTIDEVIEMKITIRGTSLSSENAQAKIKYITYYMELIRIINMVDNQITQSKNCPYCNAPLSVDKNHCEFCGKEVNILNKEWKINNIKYWNRGEK